MTAEELGLATVPDFPRDDGFVTHLSSFLGAPEPLALREIVPTDLPIAIPVIRTEDEQILVTEGMSARPLTVPAGGEAFQFAELVLRLPSDWPLTLDAFANPQHAVVAGLPTEPLRPTAGLSNGASGPNEETFGQGTVARSGDRPQQEDRLPNEFYWPIEWLKRIARYPHDNDTWLGGPHTIIANGEPPEPFAPNTKMSCLMLLANPSEFGRWTRPSVARSGDRPQQRESEEVVFYDVFGLYTEERDLELREGLPELLTRFQARFISKVLDPQRPNVATAR